MDAFSATNSSEVHQVERKKLQEKLDNVEFDLRQLRKAATMEQEALEGELELANKSIKTVQVQLENFYQDSSSGGILSPTKL